MPRETFVDADQQSGVARQARAVIEQDWAVRTNRADVAGLGSHALRDHGSTRAVVAVIVDAENRQVHEMADHEVRADHEIAGKLAL